MFADLSDQNELAPRPHRARTIQDYKDSLRSDRSYAYVPQNVKPPYKSIFDQKAMLDHLIDKEIPFEIGHHLVHFDAHLPFGAFRKRYRLDMRIYRCPL